MAFEDPSGAEQPRFRLRFSRSMVILMGAFLGLIAIIVAVVLLWPTLTGVGKQQVAQATPRPTTEVAVVTDVPAPTSAPEATAAPEATVLPEPTVPPATQAGSAVAPTAAPTEIPLPTRTAAAGLVTVVATSPPRGAGESPMPDTSSGIPWLIPVGVVLLIAVLWWRWRRARSTS